MRKPRDFDAELTALNAKVKQLKDRKLLQLGELVVATGADALPIEQLAGALLTAVEMKDPATAEGWRKRGAAVFQTPRHVARGARRKSREAATRNGGTQLSTSGESAK